MKRWLAFVAVAILAVGWAIAVAVAPLAGTTAPLTDEHSVSSRLGALTYAAGALVCHQQSGRSFHLAGARLPVCARCAALYWGGAVGVLGWLIVRARRGRLAWTDARRESRRRSAFRRTLVVLGAPIMISLATAAVGVWDPSNAWRAAISAPFGAALGAALAAVTLKDLR